MYVYLYIYMEIGREHFDVSRIDLFLFDVSLVFHAAVCRGGCGFCTVASDRYRKECSAICVWT